MALYEYQCRKCQKKTEVIQRFSDPPPTKCPHCGGVLEKLLSTPAFQFKGSGFYATDYGKPGGKPEDSSKEKEGDSSTGKEDSSKGKEGDSSKGKEGGSAPGEAGAEARADSAGDSSNGKKSSGPAAAPERAPGKASTAPSSPSKKDTKRK